MSWLLQGGLLYLVGAVIMGAYAAASDEVKTTYKRRPIPFQRLAGIVIIALFWPVVLFQSIFDVSNERNP